MPSVLQSWVERLGLRHQGDCCPVSAAVTTCRRMTPRNLVRCLRAAMLVSFDPKPPAFIETWKTKSEAGA